MGGDQAHCPTAYRIKVYKTPPATPGIRIVVTNPIGAACELTALDVPTALGKIMLLCDLRGSGDPVAMRVLLRSATEYCATFKGPIQAHVEFGAQKLAAVYSRLGLTPTHIVMNRTDHGTSSTHP